MRILLVGFILNLLAHSTLAELPAEGERVEIRRHSIVEHVTITPGAGPGAISDPTAAARHTGADSLGIGRETATPISPLARENREGSKWRKMGHRENRFGQFDGSSEDWREGGNVMDLSSEVRRRLELSTWQLKDGQWVREKSRLPIAGNSEVWGLDPTTRIWYQLTSAGDFSTAKPSANVEYVRRRLEKLTPS